MKDGKFLLEENRFFIKEIIDEVTKEKSIEYLKLQIQMAEVTRIATLAKKKDYISWMKQKERQLWKLTKTEEEKEAEALATWKNLINAQNSFMYDKKKQKPKKRKIFNIFKRNK